MVADEGHADVGGKASRSQQPAFLSPFVAHTVMESQSEGPKDPAYSSGACFLTTRIPLRGLRIRCSFQISIEVGCFSLRPHQANRLASGVFWNVPARSGMFWGALRRSRVLWGVLGRSGALWGVLGYSGVYSGTECVVYTALPASLVSLYWFLQYTLGVLLN